ncbi:aminoglycoside phosphotransferase family protein [Pelistega suis]|uniref:aminoglycoside phosphotransferase family protein n=1 Tax=Pelistega suis TaxID=1631957 RepID=UPI00211C53B3|nr:phosphotransferase [Pelistega suis]MCQ9328927.1 phosphotransferase [Pelistega suis]
MSTHLDVRLDLLKNWLHSLQNNYQLKLDTLRPASSDASFRRYFRIDTHDGTLIIMDAPPAHEDCKPFIDIAQRLSAVGLNTPRILEQDLEKGFLILNDLGNLTYYQRLQSEISDQELQSIYRDALAAMVNMQKADTTGLPIYDKPRLLTELGLFNEWYVQQYHQTTLSDKEKTQLDAIFELLVQHNDKQAKVFVHRDYHSPNLMLCNPTLHGKNPGVIDFQDAVLGPISYDVVSLVMDARTTWEEPQQLDWAIRYWEMARAANLPVPADFADFHVDYEYMGLQRNLRILGVFARLAIRDNKKHYLDHMPRVNGYVRQVANRYIAFKPLLNILDRLENIDTKVGYTF